MTNRRGRPNSPPISLTDEPLATIKRVIFDALFFSTEEFKTAELAESLKRAQHISGLALELGVDMKAIPLRDGLFEPWWMESGEITLSPAYRKNLGLFLRRAAPKYHFEDRLSLIEEYEARYVKSRNKGNASLGEVMASPGTDHQAKWLWIDGPWVIYERIDDDSRHGIAVGEIHFQPEGSVLTATIHVVRDDVAYSYRGDASFDRYLHYLYLVLDIVDGSGLKAMMSLPLAHDDKPRQSLMIGHFMYHSHHLVTETVIVQKRKELKAPVQKGRYFPKNASDDADAHPDAPDGPSYLDIDERIRDFLFPRERNMPMMPADRVANISELGKFLERRFLKNVLLDAFSENYYVYYQKNDSEELIEDELHITPRPAKAYYEGKYKHQLGAQNQEPKIYFGRTFENSRVVVVQLNEYAGELKKEEDTVLLSFDLPNERFWLPDCECLPGLVTGLQDVDRQPVSYVCLLVKQPVAGFQRLTDPRLRRYFEKIGVSRLSTERGGFRLDELGR